MAKRAYLIAIVATILLLAIFAPQISAKKVRGLRPVSEHYPIEPVHTLTPGNHNQVYYNTGGSAVITSKGVRLIPAIPARSGWLWNEYPIESTNFEVELQFEIHSKPHFGGEGFAIWFVEGNSDPSFYTNPTAIEGPIMGMNDNFKGVGVIVDVYDNDGRRNNPAIFAIKNDGVTSFDPRTEQDFEGRMITDLYKGSHRCVNDLRNTNRPVEMVIKVINNALFVYINSHASTGYRSCFSVQLNFPDEMSLKGYHLAITAASGQVSDNIDINSINVRYLRGTDQIFRENEFDLTNVTGDGMDVLTFLITFGLIIAPICYLLATTWGDYQQYKKSLLNHIDAVIVCRDLNTNLFLQYYVQMGIHCIILLTGRWFLFLLLLPIGIIRTVLYTKGYLLVSPAMVAQFSSVGGGGSSTGSSGNGILGMSITTRTMAVIGSFGLALFFLLLEVLFDITVL